MTPQTTWSLSWRRAEIGGANGHGSASGIALAQSVLANGGARGKTLMSDRGRERVLDVQFDGVDVVMGVPITWGLGYALRSPLGGLDFAPRIAYWGGNGGSMAFVDLDRRLSFGYAPNRWIRGPYELDRCRVLLTALYGCLSRP